MPTPITLDKHAFPQNHLTPEVEASFGQLLSSAREELSARLDRVAAGLKEIENHDGWNEIGKREARKAALNEFMSKLIEYGLNKRMMVDAAFNTAKALMTQTVSVPQVGDSERAVLEPRYREIRTQLEQIKDSDIVVEGDGTFTAAERTAISLASKGVEARDVVQAVVSAPATWGLISDDARKEMVKVYLRTVNPTEHAKITTAEAALNELTGMIRHTEAVALDFFQIPKDLRQDRLAEAGVFRPLGKKAA